MFATIAINILTWGPSTLLTAALLVNPPPPRDPPVVTVLCYHTFDAAKDTPFTVESPRFREQMRFIKVQGIPVIPLARLMDHLRSGAPIPEQSVVITIDDGYKTARTKAWPILKEFNFPFTLFVYTRNIGQGRTLSWADLRAMAAEGVDIQSHTDSHPLLTHPHPPIPHEDYEAWLDHELADSKRLIEQHLGKPVTALAYPYGGYDEQVVERTRRAGYLAALTCDDGNVTRFTNSLHINRRLVLHHLSLRGFSRYFSDRTLQVVEPTPRDGERVRGVVSAIQARVANVSQILPESATILVDKVGKHRLPVAIDPQTGHFRFPLPRERSGYYFISLSAQDKVNPALRREASWIFIKS